MNPTSIAQVVTAFAANPLPVLILDTCVLLDVVRAPARVGGVNTVLAARELLANAQPPGNRIYLAVTEVVATEWRSNLTETRRDAEAGASNFLTVNDLVPQLNYLPLFTPAGIPPGLAFAAGLAGQLEQLSSDLLGSAACLARDADCLSRALDRVLNQTRPAHKKGKGVKDAIILEHALELSRRLGSVFAASRYFVSSNTNDFADSPLSRLHPNLRSDFATASLEYAPSLSDAVTQLRTSGAI
jgi:hypothetical protein